MTWWEGTRLILVASVLNMVLPSKMGDVAKAFFMRDRAHLGTPVTLALVVFEKSLDMLSLLAWCALGLLLYPEKDALFWSFTGVVGSGAVVGTIFLADVRVTRWALALVARVAPGKARQKALDLADGWAAMHQAFWGQRTRLLLVSGVSVGLWFLHLVQIWLFTVALRGNVPLWTNVALSPLAILAGLAPLTFAGVGTRDAALIYFYRNHLSAAAGAALGVLCTSRYLLPALCGLPFLSQALAGLAAQKPAGQTPR